MSNKIRFTQILRERPNLLVFGTNSFWLIGDKLIKLFVAVFVSAWVARYLGPEQFGILAYATAFVAMFHAFSLLGLDNIVVRDVASNPDKASNILGTALRLRLGGSAIAYSALLLTLLLTTKNEPTLLAVTLTIGLCLFFQVTDVVDLWFQANSQNRRTVIAKTSSYLLIASLKIGLILSGATLFYFAAAQVLEAVFSAIALCVSYLFFKTKSNWTWDCDIDIRAVNFDLHANKRVLSAKFLRHCSGGCVCGRNESFRGMVLHTDHAGCQCGAYYCQKAAGRQSGIHINFQEAVCTDVVLLVVYCVDQCCSVIFSD